MGNFSTRITRTVAAAKNLGSLRWGLILIATAFLALMGLAIYLGVHDYAPPYRVKIDPSLGRYLIYHDTLYRLVRPELNQRRGK